MKKQERREWLWDKAQELAASGRFQDYREIDAQLTHFDGWDAAHSVLDSPVRREILNRICVGARKDSHNT